MKSSGKVISRKVLSGITLITLLIASATAQGRRQPPPAGDRSWTIPADTVISVQMNGTLSSGTARVGDKFTATVTVPVYVSGETVIPAGSVIEGRVTQVTPAKRMLRSGTIGLDFDDLVLPDGSSINLVGSLTSQDPATRRRIDDESRVSGASNKKTAVFVGGGGAIGAVLGGVAGGGKGAVLGGVAGAAAGGAAVLLSKGEEAQVPSGTPFGVQLKQSLTIRESSQTAVTADQPTDQREKTGPVGDQPSIADARMPARVDHDPRNDSDNPGASAASLPLSSPEMVRRAQGALREQGYYEGDADGVMNARTSAALRTYQREHNLGETGDLDPQTAGSLGITNAPAQNDRTAERAREVRRETREPSDNVLATVLSASASRTGEGAIYVSITTQANTGGWRWFGEQVVNGDTLEVYARAVRPTGMTTQVITKGRIDITVREGVEYVRRVVVHSASGDQAIALEVRADSRRDTGSQPAAAPSSATSLQRKAEELLSEYQRVCGVRMTGTGVELENAGQYREPEIELFFAIDSFANATQLYARIATSLRDRQSLRSATVAMARQARRTDRVISTTTSRAADSLASRWDAIRQDVLRLMQEYSINSGEIEN